MPGTETLQRRTSIEDIDTDIVTLPAFLIEEQKKYQNARGDFTLLLNALQFAFKFISQTIAKAELINLIGLTGGTNSTGDSQKKLDVLGDDIFKNAMSGSGVVRIMVSEEQEDPIYFEHNEASYAVCCDPIDGSSNLDAGVAVGTIVSIFRLAPGSEGRKEDILRPGTEMVAACYAMYGASTHLLLTMGNGVHSFTLDHNIGEFILVNRRVEIPEQRSIYSINEGNTAFWSQEISTFINSLKCPFPIGGENVPRPYSSRYIGSMVADVHRTFLYGGLFAYPGDRKHANGKIRLLYEAFPMAYLMEQAGGKAVNDRGERILDLVPEDIHDQTSLWLGSPVEVNMFLKHIGKS